MSAQLGLNVRVWIGWSPPHRMTPAAVKCVQGVITAGPFPAGPIASWPAPILRYIKPEIVRVGETIEPSWLVRYEADKARFQICVESVLFPIDGGEPVAIESEEGVRV